MKTLYLNWNPMANAISIVTDEGEITPVIQTEQFEQQMRELRSNDFENHLLIPPWI